MGVRKNIVHKALKKVKNHNFFTNWSLKGQYEKIFQEWEVLYSYNALNDFASSFHIIHRIKFSFIV